MAVLAVTASLAAQTPATQSPATDNPAAQYPAPQTPPAQPSTPEPAQPSTPDDDQQKPMGTSGTTDAKSVTLSGCLREGATTGTFVLANATESTAGASRTGGGMEHSTTPPATGTAGSTMQKTYSLSAGSDVNLKAHVGHKVEVTGTVAAQADSKASTPSTSSSSATSTTPETAGTAGTAGRAGASADARINVKSVKMISTDCPAI
jgi:hypothetical protein